MRDEELRRQLEIYGVMAEFEDEEALLEAARRAYGAGYREMDAFTPFPVDGLAEVLGHKTGSRLHVLALVALAVGAAVALGLQYYAMVMSYPINVGGRPLNSLPAFLPLTFETMILFAALTVFVGLLLAADLPARYRPLRRAPNFGLATRNRFFLVIFSRDNRFDQESVHRFLETLGPLEVNVVET